MGIMVSVVCIAQRAAMIFPMVFLVESDSATKIVVKLYKNFVLKL